MHVKKSSEFNKLLNDPRCLNNLVICLTDDEGAITTPYFKEVPVIICAEEEALDYGSAELEYSE